MDLTEMENSLIKKAKVLIEALPYIKRFSGKTVLIKYGGKAMTDAKLKASFATDVVLLKYVGINPVIVHGGGPQINVILEKLGIEPKFIKGLRITTKETMEVVEMVLGGLINKDIVDLINSHGGRAVGISGKDGGLIKPKKMEIKDDNELDVDLGMVGEVESVSPDILTTLENSNFIPIISPIASDGINTYNINADRVASAVASSLKAEKMVLLTDTNGVCDESGNLANTLDNDKIEYLMSKQVIKGGMVEKVKACVNAINNGVSKVHIIDGRIPHAVLLEIFTDAGIGTQIVHPNTENNFNQIQSLLPLE